MRGKPEIVFEDDENQFVVSEEEQVENVNDDSDVPEEYKAKSKKELIKEKEQLEQEANQARALQAGIAELGEKLARPVVIPQNPVIREEEDLNEKIKTELFGDNPASVLEKVIDRRVQQKYGVIMQGALYAAEKAIKNDPEEGHFYKKYEGEIKQFIAGLPVESQMNPQVFEFALNQIKQRHFDDIVNEKVEKALNEKLKAQGGKQTSDMYFQEGTTSIAVPQSSEKKKVYLTNGEIDALKRESEILGIDFNILVDRKKSSILSKRRR